MDVLAGVRTFIERYAVLAIRRIRPSKAAGLALKVARAIGRNFGLFVAYVVNPVAIFSAGFAVWAVYSQFEQYNAQSFNRDQEAKSFAWAAVGGANGSPNERGQSAALSFLASERALRGGLNLNGTRIQFGNGGDDLYSDPILFILGDSTYCGTTLAFEGSLFSTYDFHNSLLRSAKLSGVLNTADFTSADLQGVEFSGTYVSNTSFVGADLRRAIVWGGAFTDSDFNGADLRDARFSLGIELPGVVLAPAPDEKHYWWIRSDPGYYDFYTYSDDADTPLLSPDASEGDALRVLYPNYTEIFGDTAVDLTRSRFQWADVRGTDLSATNRPYS